MIKFVCSILIIGGGVYIGLGEVRTLHMRVKLLRQLEQAFSYIKSEISFTLAPLPVIFKGLETHGGKMVKRFFADCAEVNDSDFSAVWNGAILKRFGDRLKTEEIESMRALGTVLGRYDAQSQISAMDHTLERMTQYISAAENDRTSLGRLYGAMGFFISAAIAVVLI